MRFIWLLPIALVAIACGNKKPANRFSDDVLVKLADFQDHRLSDSLIAFFSHRNDTYREAAVMAFASMQDTMAVEALGKVFNNDPDPAVRAAAAFALGQIGTEKAYRALMKDGANLEDAEVLEGIGKSLPLKGVPIDRLSPWGLYYLSIRGPVDTSLNKQASNYLQPKYDEYTRLGAAHYFNRGAVSFGAFTNQLLNTAQYDSSVYVRMAAASALRKSINPEVRIALQNMLTSESDYRVRVNILRALQSYSLAETKELFEKALSDEYLNVAIAAAEVIRQAAAPANYSLVVMWARTSANWRVRVTLYEAALSISGNKELSEEIIQRYEQSDHLYEKAGLVRVLGSTPMQFNFVQQQLLSQEHPVIRTAAVNALASMNKHPLLEPSMRESFLRVYKKALHLGDAGVTALIAAALADPASGFKDIITDYSFLIDARDKLSLPREMETLQSLEAAISYFAGTNVTQPINQFNNPIDWAFVKKIPADQHVSIETTRGLIKLRLYVNEAPGTVASFLRNVNDGYYNGKNFHRVVPNFVIQGGCNRGDGYGSEGYSIRSEFSRRRFTEGSVGMASAGKDTEGTQWFITHSPTPHLNGRYTLFGQVVEGMDVVHRIEVGDRILNIVASESK